MEMEDRDAAPHHSTIKRTVESFYILKIIDHRRIKNHPNQHRPLQFTEDWEATELAIYLSPSPLMDSATLAPHFLWFKKQRVAVVEKKLYHGRYHGQKLAEIGTQFVGILVTFLILRRLASAEQCWALEIYFWKAQFGAFGNFLGENLMAFSDRKKFS